MEPSSHRFDIALQGRDQHIAPLFEARDRILADAQGGGKFLLRPLHSLPQVLLCIQVHNLPFVVRLRFFHPVHHTGRDIRAQRMPDPVSLPGTSIKDNFTVPGRSYSSGTHQPEDFVFPLTVEEKSELVANCDRLERLKHSTAFPLAFTEHGVIMSASVLNSKRAVGISVCVVRAFVRMREAMAEHRDFAQRLDEMEKKHDARFRVVFDAIRVLMEPLKTPRRRIGL